MRKIDVENDGDISDVMRALLAPVRPYGYIMAYTGGKHSRIQGHFQFFEMDTEKINAGMHALAENDSNVSVMLCGPMTKRQVIRIKEMAHVDTQKYIDMKTWLIRNSSKSQSGMHRFLSIATSQPYMTSQIKRIMNTEKKVTLPRKHHLEVEHIIFPLHIPPPETHRSSNLPQNLQPL